MTDVSQRLKSAYFRGPCFLIHDASMVASGCNQMGLSINVSYDGYVTLSHAQKEAFWTSLSSLGTKIRRGSRTHHKCSFNVFYAGVYWAICRGFPVSHPSHFPSPIPEFVIFTSQQQPGCSLEALLVILTCPPLFRPGAHMLPARLFVLDAEGQPGSGGQAPTVP